MEAPGGTLPLYRGLGRQNVDTCWCGQIGHHRNIWILEVRLRDTTNTGTETEFLGPAKAKIPNWDLLGHA